MQVLLSVCGDAHLPQIARALENHNGLAGVWLTAKNSTGVSPNKFRRAWLFHLLVKPFYHLTSAGFSQKVHYALYPVWQFWFRRQRPPFFDVAYSIPGQATELFDLADKAGALKVIDSVNSHPTSAYGYWQRECDLFSPGTVPTIPRWIFARANRELERADLILCPSEFVRDSMIYNGIPRGKCELNPYGVYPSEFSPRQRIPDRPRFVCVGLIGLRKGQQYLFRAFEKVRKRLPDAELICVGRPFSDFKREWRRWKGTFQHYEGIPQKQLAEILSSATAFVLPSNEEGFAKAVIEGMASGLPVIATHESGATTIVRDGQEGFIVRARDVDQIAEAMIKIATDREANERMGRAAYARATVSNTWDDFAGRMIRICEAALKRTKNENRNG
jgi:glycosyltransferase involved in cell wall biosynthesis